MPTDTHIIQRQVLDITLDTDRDAYLVQEEVRRVYYERVVPMLDATFSALAGPGEVIRLDRLTLDLGRVTRRNLEEELIAQVRVQLDEVLAQRVRTAPASGGPPAEEPEAHHTTTGRSRLEVFVAFVQTGRVLWWVPDPSGYDPDAELGALLDDAPEPLVAALRRIDGPAVRQRLAHQVTPEALTRLIGRVMPWMADTLLGVLRRLDIAYAARPVPMLGPPAFRAVLWEEAVGFVLRPSTSAVALEHFVETVAAHAVARGVPAAHLPERLATVVDSSSLEGTILAAWLREQAPADAEAASAERGEAERSSAEEVASESPKPGAEGINRAEEIAAAPDEPLAEASSPRPAEPETEPPASTMISPDVEQESPELRTVQTPAEARATAPDEMPPALTAAHDGGPDEPVSYALETPQEGDVQYITNAGLILLWPFLGRFFKHLGLVEEQAFVTDEARQRAVLLTHYLGTGETEAAEHLLLLNKLLCGLPQEATVPRTLDLTPREADESRVVLETVVAHWQALKKTSPDGLRQAFLQREGKLVRQADQWALFIERKGYDMLLDRLPWSISIVKMAWMPEPIFVEW